MKIFLSCSGLRSRQIAEAFNDWLPRVIQAVKPFFYPEVEKGVQWSNELDNALEGTGFGIVCLTPHNLDSRWIHYETGALSKSKDAIVWTLLHGLKYEDVPQPLGKFNHTLTEKDDVRKLVRSINKRLGALGEALQDQRLEESFETYWPLLEEQLLKVEEISLAQDKEEPVMNESRDVGAILGEILESVRNQDRRLSTIEGRIVGPSPSGGADSPYKNDFYKEITLHLTVQEPNLQGLVADLCKGFQQSIPGTQAGLKDVKESKVLVTVNFPYPIDEDFIDDVYSRVKQELGLRTSGYSSNPSW